MGNPNKQNPPKYIKRHTFTNPKGGGSIFRAWTINANGLANIGDQHDLLLRAEQEDVHLLMVQETYFKETSSYRIGKWLVIINQHAPEDKAPETEREKHREDLNTVLSAIP